MAADTPLFNGQAIFGDRPSFTSKAAVHQSAADVDAWLD